MSRQDTIRKAVQKSRKSWLHYTIAQEKAIYRALEEAQESITKTLLRYAEQGKLPPQRLTALLGSPTKPDPSSIRGIMRMLRPKLQSEIKRGITQSVNFGFETQIMGLNGVDIPKRAKLGLGDSFIGADGKLRKYDVKNGPYSASVWAKMNTNAVDFLMRTQYSGITLSQRIWDITWDTEKRIRGRITTGVALGESVDKVARDCKQYLIRPDDRFHRVRKDGKLVLSKPMKKFHPGRGVYRSSFQNARRLARTEMARAYHEGMIRYMKRKTWIDGGIWRLGGGGPWKCECPSLNGRFFKKGEFPGLQHVSCMCYIEPHIKPEVKEPLLKAAKQQVATAY